MCRSGAVAPVPPPEPASWPPALPVSGGYDRAVATIGRTGDVVRVGRHRRGDRPATASVAPVASRASCASARSDSGRPASRRPANGRRRTTRRCGDDVALGLVRSRRRLPSRLVDRLPVGLVEAVLDGHRVRTNSHVDVGHPRRPSGPAPWSRCRCWLGLEIEFGLKIQGIRGELVKIVCRVAPVADPRWHVHFAEAVVRGQCLRGGFGLGRRRGRCRSHGHRRRARPGGRPRAALAACGQGGVASSTRPATVRVTVRGARCNIVVPIDAKPL